MLVMSLEGSVGVAVGLGGDGVGDGEALALLHPDHCLNDRGSEGHTLTICRASPVRVWCPTGGSLGKENTICLSLLGFPFQWQKGHKTDIVMNYLSTSPINPARKK